MSIFIIYLKILNCQPLFPTNLLIIVSTVARTFLNIYTFWHFPPKTLSPHWTSFAKTFQFRTFTWLSAPNRLYYHHSHYFPRLRKSDVLLPPPTLHRSFSFATKSTFRPLPLYYIYLCTKYYAISTLTRTHSHTLDIPYITRRTLWEGKPAGIGRAQKMVGAYPRTPARPHARNNTPARPPTIHKTTDWRIEPARTPENAPKTPQPPEPPRAYAISKVYITYFWQKINNKI